jgi:hypothetical protein
VIGSEENPVIRPTHRGAPVGHLFTSPLWAPKCSVAGCSTTLVLVNGLGFRWTNAPRAAATVAGFFYVWQQRAGRPISTAAEGTRGTESRSAGHGFQDGSGDLIDSIPVCPWTGRFRGIGGRDALACPVPELIGISPNAALGETVGEGWSPSETVGEGKPFSYPELRGRIRALLRRAQHPSPSPRQPGRLADGQPRRPGRAPRRSTGRARTEGVRAAADADRRSHARVDESQL